MLLVVVHSRRFSHRQSQQRQPHPTSQLQSQAKSSLRAVGDGRVAAGCSSGGPSTLYVVMLVVLGENGG